MRKKLRAVAADREHRAWTVFILANDRVKHFGGQLGSIVVQLERRESDAVTLDDGLFIPNVNALQPSRVSPAHA